MDPVENQQATAEELIFLARQHGIDLKPYCVEGNFLKDRRFIWLWRKDELPWSGPTDESLGTLHYNMQGTISLLPCKMKGSASIFRGSWHETGTFENIEEAYELVKAWLLDWKEVDDLPHRSVRSYGI